MVRLVLSLFVAALATPVGEPLAVGQTGIRTLDVPLGGIAEVDVDFKIGFACDDLTILRAHMETRGAHNWFVVEGLAPGRTWCRVGSPELPSYLFDVTVRP